MKIELLSGHKIVGSVDEDYGNTRVFGVQDSHGEDLAAFESLDEAKAYARKHGLVCGRCSQAPCDCHKWGGNYD
jgi:hypothetical protein